MPDRILRTKTDVDSLAVFFASQKLPLTVTWQQGKHRTCEQNRLSRLWLNQASAQLADRETEELRGLCKLELGVPILRAENSYFCEKYDRVIRPLPYPHKLACMMEPLDFPVTRLMRTPQMVRYLDAMERKFVGMGLEISDPDPDLAKHMSKYRERA